MVQVIPKKSVKKQLALKDMLPWFSLLLVVVIIGLYFIFVLQINRAEVSLEQVKTELSEVQTEEELELEKIILSYKRKVDDLLRMLKGHEKPTEFFGFLEKFIHPAIYLSSLSMNSDTGKVFLKGVSDDFKSLGEQILIFEREPFIGKTELSDIILLQEGKIQFDINFSLLPKNTEESVED